MHSAGCWIGLNPPLAAILAHRANAPGHASACQGGSEVVNEFNESADPYEAASVVAKFTPHTQGEWNAIFQNLSFEGSARLLDLLSPVRILPQQFVDDSIVVTSGIAELSRTNVALVFKWKHAYQGSSKGQES